MLASASPLQVGGTTQTWVARLQLVVVPVPAQSPLERHWTQVEMSVAQRLVDGVVAQSVSSRPPGCAAPAWTAWTAAAASRSTRRSAAPFARHGTPPPSARASAASARGATAISMTAAAGARAAEAHVARARPPGPVAEFSPAASVSAAADERLAASGAPGSTSFRAGCRAPRRQERDSRCTSSTRAPSAC